MSSPVSSSDEEFQPRQSEVDHVSESTSTEGQRGTEQRSQGPGGRRQRVSQRDDDRIDNDLLISLVQERVPLWDSRDQQHAVNSVLRRLWSEVAQALWDGWENSPPRVRNAFVEKVRTRWRSMKDRFNKDLRAEKSAASGSGARHRLYKYHRVLAFLRPVLLMRTTHCTTVATGSGAVLQPAATDPSQPSSSAAPGGSSTLTGDQGAGPSGLPLSQSSFAAPIFAGSSRQRQRASDRSLMPEFLHLSSVLHEAIKALGDRMDVTHNLLNCRIQDVAKSVDQLKADLKKPAHHFFNQILEGMSEHLSPDLQLSVMQACNVAFVQAMQQSQSRNVAAYPTVPSLSQVNTIPTSAAYHCTATSIPSTGVLHYSANTMTSAVGHPTATTVTTAAPAWTSSADTTMTQDPGVAYRPGTLPMQQDPSMQYRTGPPQMQQDPGLAFRTGPTPMQQDRGLSYLTGPTPMQQDRGVAFRAGHPPMQQDPSMAYRTGPPMMQHDQAIPFQAGPTLMQQDPSMAFCSPPPAMQQDNGMGFVSPPQRGTRILEGFLFPPPQRGTRTQAGVYLSPHWTQTLPSAPQWRLTVWRRVLTCLPPTLYNIAQEDFPQPGKPNVKLAKRIKNKKL
ncbi:uncharacterized protein LOC143815964 [Ranitomeya variabilis]|uniref:uncharacterized protein LOC143815964 n=2 Tax=Ranitomeya variabilis TaxID=490064 RepID=UPI0040569777